MGEFPFEQIKFGNFCEIFLGILAFVHAIHNLFSMFPQSIQHTDISSRIIFKIKKTTSENFRCNCSSFLYPNVYTIIPYHNSQKIYKYTKCIKSFPNCNKYAPNQFITIEKLTPQAI